ISFERGSYQASAPTRGKNARNMLFLFDTHQGLSALTAKRSQCTAPLTEYPVYVLLRISPTRTIPIGVMMKGGENECFQ
ncbi:TPA: hypothetical protein ACW4B7_002374, partial [Salmonella enterica subsp. enterica serovar Schwarzengrund]